jgi:hypothetical protein
MNLQNTNLSVLLIKEEYYLDSGFPSTDYDSVADKNQKQKELLHEAIMNIATTRQYRTKNHQRFVLSVTVLLLLVFIVGIASVFLYVENAENDETPYLKSQYQILNLRGDVIDTWLTWRIVEGDLFHVHLDDSKLVTDETSQAISDVVMSLDTVEIDDSLLHKGPSGQASIYYKGWSGALQSISEDTFFTLPDTLHYHIAENGEGHILIKLTDQSSPDGYSGYTTSIVDQSSNQILKSTITIYDADKLSLEELKTIVRHELGHGFGLAHSSAPEDLMYPTIETDYPYISECDISAIEKLYNNLQESRVICEI